jgi:hypothetical protein
MEASEMTSIAYPAKPPLPGVDADGGALLGGWIVAGAATLFLYLAADGLGAIAHRNAYPGAAPNDRSFGVNRVSLNDWAYPASGPWTLFANVAVVALVLVLTTLATAWWMRRSYEHISEGRLGLVLLLTGWLPVYAGGPIGGLLGFLVAVWLVRVWVTRAQDRLPTRTTIISTRCLLFPASRWLQAHALGRSAPRFPLRSTLRPLPHPAATAGLRNSPAEHPCALPHLRASNDADGAGLRQAQRRLLEPGSSL